MTLGLMHEPNLDKGAMWPTAFALKDRGAGEKVGELNMAKKIGRTEKVPRRFFMEMLVFVRLSVWAG